MQENRVKYTELTFQLIVESSPSAIVLVNKEGKIAYVNNQTEKLFGYTRTEVIGQTVEILIPERYGKHHSQFRDMFFQLPVVRSMGAGRELFALRKDRTEFPIEIGLNPVVTVDGTLVLASIIDITERKKAEEQFRLVVESAPNAMVLVNDAGTITLVNKQAEDLFQYARNELVGNKLEILIPERFRGQHPHHRGTFFANPNIRAMGAGRDLFAKRKDNTEIQVEIGLNPIDTPEGKMVLASIIDITERKVHELISKRQIALEIKNKELEQFAYIAYHDLQEPLRTVANYLQIFEEDYSEALDTHAMSYLRAIGGATKRMSALVRALLDYSRLGLGKKLALVNCKKLVEDVIADLQVMIQASGAVIDLFELPELLAYEVELRQLFQNLISNAIKFRQPGVPPHIQIQAEKTESYHQFSVRDNGIGIMPEHFERIFQIFQRLHAIEEYEGNGIGLANCKKITELHEGEIWIDSTPGAGTTFYFTVSTALT